MFDQPLAPSSTTLRITSPCLLQCLDLSSDAVVIINQAGTIVSVNGQAENLFGYTRSELLGEPLETLLPARFREAHRLHRAHYFSAPSTRLMEAGLDLFGLRKNGNVFPVNVSLRPLLLDEALCVVSVIRDVTERKALEEHIVAKTREHGQEKLEFISRVSHDLQTPLTSIKGFADVLLEDEADGVLSLEQREFIQIIRESANRLTTLVNDLRDISWIESGKVHLQCTALDLVALIDKGIQTLQPQLSSKGQQITLNIEDPLIFVWGDANKVAQIFSNVLSNASKYTLAAGSICVTTRLQGASVCIAIQDTGVGMTREEQDHLFTKFFRAKNRATQDVDGTGLGLVIARSLLELHGGTIWVESEEGKGTTCFFTLPLIEVVQEPVISIPLN